MNDTQNKHKSAELRRGVMTFLALAVLTAIEYVLGTLDNMTIPLVIIALIKAVLVLWFFMHLPRVFSEGGHE